MYSGVLLGFSISPAALLHLLRAKTGGLHREPEEVATQVRSLRTVSFALHVPLAQPSCYFSFLWRESWQVTVEVICSHQLGLLVSDYLEPKCLGHNARALWAGAHTEHHLVSQLEVAGTNSKGLFYCYIWEAQLLKAETKPRKLSFKQYREKHQYNLPSFLQRTCVSFWVIESHISR